LASPCDAKLRLYEWLEKTIFVLDNFPRQFWINIDEFLINPRQMYYCKNRASKALILANLSCFFDSKLNHFYTPFTDGLPQKQLFKTFILVNRFDFTTCGWATF
jgi:hypothetical protein